MSARFFERIFDCSRDKSFESQLYSHRDKFKRAVENERCLSRNLPQCCLDRKARKTVCKVDMGRPRFFRNATVPAPNMSVALLLLCSFVWPTYATMNNGNGPEVQQGQGQVALFHDTDVTSSVRSLMRDLAPAATTALMPSPRSVAGRLVLESIVFLAVLATSMTFFPGWYSVLVALSALLSLYESATTAAAATPSVFTARADDVTPLSINCQVQVLCEVTRMTRARFPVVATLLKSAAKGDHRGGPFVQAILAGLSRVDCDTLFGCPRHRIEFLLAKQPQR